MTDSRPKIFISSTIYDFRDLRSALKYWLEQLGYKVLLSEFNDFTKPLDENSYKACEKAIAQCDYYVLFIGSRVGGLYDSANRVSITRNEYRTAYDLMKTKKLKLVIFVREEIWTVRKDRKSLKTFLENDCATRRDIPPSEIKKIISHSSDIVNDTEAIFGFIEEVTRAQEMKEAVNSKGPFPIGNWVHTYSTFQDVVNVLRIEFGIKDSLSKVALRENLKRELYSNLMQLTQKSEQGISPTYEWASFTRKYLSGNSGASSQIPGRYLRRLVIYAFFAGTGHRLSDRFIAEALVSGEFLDYDLDLHTYRSGLINDKLSELQQNIVRLRYLEQSLRDHLTNFMTKHKSLSETEGEVSVSNLDLMIPLAFADCQQNIVTLTIALIKALDGDVKTLKNLKLNPTSPLAAEAEKIKSETVSFKEIVKWVREQ